MNLIKPIAKAFYLKLSVNIPQPRVLARMFFFFSFFYWGLLKVIKEFVWQWIFPDCNVLITFIVVYRTPWFWDNSPLDNNHLGQLLPGQFSPRQMPPDNSHLGLLYCARIIIPGQLSNDNYKLQFFMAIFCFFPWPNYIISMSAFTNMCFGKGMRCCLKTLQRVKYVASALS